MIVAVKMMKLLRRRCNRFLLLIISVFTITTSLLYYKAVDPIHLMSQLIESLTTEELFPYTNLQDDHWLLRTSACFIERDDPWDVMTKHYFERQPSISCPLTNEDVLIILNHDDGYLRVNFSAREQIPKGNLKGFKCRKWKIWRNLIEEDDNIYRVSREFLEFENATLMNHEYALVECYINNQRIYHNYFYRVLRKTEVETKCQSNQRFYLQKNPNCLENDRLSVLVVGVSSVSRSHFLRQFPQTFDLLANDSSVLDFQGYTRIGPDTFQCLIPYLSGSSFDELKKGCLGGDTKTFDNCSLLFGSFEKAGYRTAFVENGVSFNVNNNKNLGCKKQVAQYYSRTLYGPLSKFVSNYRNGCWGGKSDDEQVLDWAYEFQKEFYQTPHFGHFWLGRFAEAGESADTMGLDTVLADIMQRMRGWLNNTVLVLMGDHGQRYGAFRETEQGRIEENLPFLFIKFPDWFQLAYPSAAKNLFTNRFRLTTAFDLHRTLQAVIQCQYLTPSIGSSNEKISEIGKKRGISFFQHISQNRTCADAGISDAFCPCKQNVHIVDPTAPINSHLANTLVRFLNDLTERKRYVCSLFHLKSVIYVKRILLSSRKSKSSSSSNKYIVAVALVPGDVKIEATIHHHKINDSVAIQPDIRRINRDNSFGDCIKNDGLVKLVCHCVL